MLIYEFNSYYKNLVIIAVLENFACLHCFRNVCKTAGQDLLKLLNRWTGCVLQTQLSKWMQDTGSTGQDLYLRN